MIRLKNDTTPPNDVCLGRGRKFNSLWVRHSDRLIYVILRKKYGPKVPEMPW